MLTQIDLCSGVGAGFCYAGLQLGFNLIGVAEIDEFCSNILQLRYPGVHNYKDVHDIPRLARQRLGYYMQLPDWDEVNFPHGQAIAEGTALRAIAICDLVDCTAMTPEFIEQQSTTEILCGDWQIGRYAWKLENIQTITEPFAVKGKQGLYELPTVGFA